jgi:exonuclease VII small subunit
VQIADGKEPDAESVAQVLRDAEKSPDDLQKAVELLQQRRQWRQCYDELPRLVAERKEIEKQIEVANAALEAAEREFDRAINPLLFRRQQINESQSECDKAQKGLWETCTDATVLDKLADVQSQLETVWQESRDLRNRVESLRKLATSDRDEAGRQKMIVGGDREAKAYIERAKQHDRKIAEYEATLTKADKIVADLERQKAGIREQMLVP